MITGDDYTAAYHAFDDDLPDDLPEVVGEWRVAMTWTAFPTHDRRQCSVVETPALDLDRGWPKRATCTCGWDGPVRALEVAAAVDLANHAWPGWQDQPEEQAPRTDGQDDRGRKTKGHWLDAFTNRSSRVIRANVCGPGAKWWMPALCRGLIPYAGAGVQLPGLIIACVCPAHWDIAEAKARGEAERDYQAEWQRRTAERWRSRQAGIQHHRPTPLDDGQLTLF